MCQFKKRRRDARNTTTTRSEKKTPECLFSRQTGCLRCDSSNGFFFEGLRRFRVVLTFEGSQEYTPWNLSWWDMTSRDEISVKVFLLMLLFCRKRRRGMKMMTWLPAKLDHRTGLLYLLQDYRSRWRRIKEGTCFFKKILRKSNRNSCTCEIKLLFERHGYRSRERIWESLSQN